MELDKLYDDCVLFARSKEYISSSSLQVKFSLGYMRANRIIEQLVNNNIISGPDGSNHYRVVAPSSDVVKKVETVDKSLTFTHLKENTTDDIDAISQLVVSYVEDPERLTLSVTVEDSELTAYMTKDQAIVMARHILNLYKADFEEGTTRIGDGMMTGLYLIHAGISNSFSGSETYPEARPIMEHAHNCIIEWGREHKIDCHGEQFRKQQ